MTMLKSTKYRKHRESKYEFPTRGANYGEKFARQSIEKRLGRQLQEDTITRHTQTQWVFCEPKKKEMA